MLETVSQQIAKNQRQIATDQRQIATVKLSLNPCDQLISYFVFPTW